jgi:hypothetical protein
MKTQNLIPQTMLYKTITGLLVAILISSMNLNAQNNDENKHFDGPYIGLTVGSQNIFGGAFIDDLDVLAQKSGLVIEFHPGFRKQVFKNRIVIGAEIQFGFTDGNLEQLDTRNQLKIEYENNSQFGYGIHVGPTIGKNKNVLLYAYGNVTKRNFDITIFDTSGNIFGQEDGQRFLRYGIGLETPIYKKFNIKTSIGKTDVDYGELITNINVENKLDFNLGILYQF